MALAHIGDSIGFNRTNIGFPTFATVTVDFDLSDASFVLDDVGVPAAEDDVIVLSFNIGSGSANDVSLTGTGWTRQEDEATGGTRVIVYTKTVGAGETSTTWTATYSVPAGNAEQPRLHLFRGITEAGLKAHDSSIVATGYTATAPSVNGGAAAGDYLISVFVGDGPDADSYGTTTDISPAQDDVWDQVSASDGRATTVVSRTLTASGATGDTTSARTDHVAGGEHFGAHLLFAGLRKFPLRLFPRNDDLDGPRLPQFHDSTARSARLGGGDTYD